MNRLDDWLRRLTKHQLEAVALDLQRSISAITKRGLTVLLMLAVSWMVGYLPGAGILLFGRMTISVLLRFGIAVAAAVLLLTVYRHAVCVLGRGAREAFRLPREETAFDGSVSKLAWSVTLLVYVCLVHWVLIRAFSPILAVLTSRTWPLKTIDICSLAVAVIAIIGIFIGASPLFGNVGDFLARRVAPETGGATQSKCPKCGVLCDACGKFCSFCGCAIPQGEDKPAAGRGARVRL